jgi:two-component system OmpR family sensor kinase
MKRSLQRHLSQVLGAAILIAGLLAAAASFWLAYLEAKEFQDDMLRQIAVLVAGSKSTSSDTQQMNVGDGIKDPETRVTVYRLSSPTVPAWLKRDLSPGLHTLRAGTDQMRVFVHGGHSHVVVVQPTDARDEIAISSALFTLIPLLLLLPILIWLIVRIVRNQLEPVANLARNMDKQSADHLILLQSDNLPLEIIPFVHAINRLLKKVKLLTGQQRRFIADAAHELRSPLTALSIQSQNLLHAGSLEAMRERVLPLSEGIEQAKHLTEQLLNLARTRSDAREPVKTNVSAMARELIAEYLPLADTRHIDLGLDEIAPLVLHSEPETLRLIIRNALENALKYTPKGGIVTLRLIRNDDSAIIEVIDNGPGIPASERERVFDSFYRMPGTAGEGSGLGLAIAKEAAIRLNGIISLHERQPCCGLIFRYKQMLNDGSYREPVRELDFFQKIKSTTL